MPLIALLILLLLCPVALSDAVTVAVAANFRPAAEALAMDFESGSDHRVTLVTASTGVLFSQIRHGAPFDVFLSADREAPARLVAAGDASGPAFCYARGELVLLGGPVTALANPGLTLAIANPATAPYGRAALEVTARAAFAAGGSRKTVRGNNALQAYQLFRQHAVDLALVPRSLHPDAQALPLDWYTPIEQYAVQLQRARENPAATDFSDYLRRPATVQMISRLGYQPCHG